MTVVALLLVRCGDVNGVESDDDTEEGADDDASADILAAAWFLSEEIPTIVTVYWSSMAVEVEDHYVEYRIDEDVLSRAPARRTDNEYEAQLLGLKPSTEYSCRAVLVTAAGSQHSDWLSLTTGPVPTDLPSFEVTAGDSSQVSRGYLVTAIVGSTNAPVILDRDGDYVWWFSQLELAKVGAVRLSRDRLWVLVVGMTTEDETEALTLFRISIDGSSWEATPLSFMQHHDYLELPNGDLAMLAREVRQVLHEQIIGDRIVLMSPDGVAETLWSLWDHETYESDGPNETAGLWADANAIDYVDDQDAFYVSFRLHESIYKIDRPSGEIVWRLGGQQSDFALSTGPEDGFSGQHQFHVLDGGILIFDNAAMNDLEARVVEYRLDETAGTAELIWSYKADPPLCCPVLGDVTRMADGNTLINFSHGGQYDEVDPAGELLWRLNAPMATGTWYSEWVDTLYGTSP